jgi:Tol biopolymer transport system component/DNA-binding winged helix-turn-helix (wHTH) protein
MVAVTYSFHGISVDRARLSVTRGGLPVDLEPKALDVLLFLLDNRDRLVTKDELMDAVWKDTFVTPNVLTRAIAQIRKALGDDADAPTIIETVSKRGYRLIAPVEVSPSPVAPAPAAASPPQIHEPTTTAYVPPASPRRSMVPRVAAALLVVAGIVAIVAVMTRDRTSEAAPGSLPAPKRLTTRAGFDGQPAVSPDGRSVAYVSDRTGGLEIYVTGLVATGTETQLTSNGGNNMQPDWSPDGNWLAFHSRKLGGVWVVSSHGGQPQQVAQRGSSPAWAPDSQQLVFTSDTGGFAEQGMLFTVRRDGSDLKQITTLEQTPGGAVGPAWSHNGKFIAFSNSFGGVGTKPGLFLLSVSDGRIRQVYAELFQNRPEFAPEDDAIYWIGLTLGEASIRRIAIDPGNGEPRGDMAVVRTIDGRGEGLSISRGGVVAFGSAQDDDNFWRMDLNSTDEPRRVTNDTVRNLHPMVSSQGRLAFARLSDGHPSTVWLMNVDGSGAEVLLPGMAGNHPQWSRDGSRVMVLEQDKLVWVDVATRRVIDVPFEVPKIQPGFPRLSPDDRTLAYHRIEADGQMFVWGKPVDGGPEKKMAVDREGVGFPVWSNKGDRLGVEMRRGVETHIGIVPADKLGPIQDVVTERGNNWLNSWSLDDQRIAYAGERDGVWNVFEVTVATRVSRQLTHFTLPIGYLRYPTYTADGRQIIFERAIRTSNIWTMTLK